jgi:hypothetical protein
VRNTTDGRATFGGVQSVPTGSVVVDKVMITPALKAWPGAATS